VNFSVDAGENDAQLLVDEIRTCSGEVPAGDSKVSDLMTVFSVT
jgi:hypothetical protein